MLGLRRLPKSGLHMKDDKAPERRAEPSIDVEHVLDLAAEMFAEYGFDGVSMRELGRAADCATPSIYYHFTSKANLYNEMFAHKIDQTIDLISERIGGLSDPQARMRELVIAFFDMFTGDRTLLLLMQRDVIDAAVAKRRFLSKRQYDHFVSLIQRLGSEVVGSPIDDATAFSIASLIFGYCELANAVYDMYEQRDEAVLSIEKKRLVGAVMKLLDKG